MARLFEYAAILQPEEDEDGNVKEKAKLIVDVTRVLAESEQEVSIRAARELPNSVIEDLDRVEIIIRPF